jgi:Arc/MetJ-type ribon-helix-helix transcriptional regulator
MLKRLYADGESMFELKARTTESEKITINLGFVDLGHVDLMVQEGFYSNRTDFIRTAIRNQIERHADVVKSSVVRQTLDLGLRRYARAELEAVISTRQKLHLNVLGLLTLDDDVTPDVACAAIASITVLGAFHARADVKSALADRIR